MVRGLVGSGGGISTSRGETPGAEVETGVTTSVVALAFGSAGMVVRVVVGRPGERTRSGGSGVTALIVRPWTLALKLDRRLVVDGRSMAPGEGRERAAGSWPWRWLEGSREVLGWVVSASVSASVSDRVHPLTLIGIGRPTMPLLIHAHSGPASAWLCRLSWLREESAGSRESTSWRAA